VEPDPWEVGGGPGSVAATGWDASRGFDVTTTPAMRMVLSLADWDDSRWVSLTGVSGHPTSSHYTDQTDLLVAGETLPFLFSADAVADAADSELTLRPAP
ncbi:MAG: penicillin acylase family protein, partial [Actinomycetota bacterium]|nr:penicillin acylase family protein [Actinomycetota bacterium]